MVTLNGDLSYIVIMALDTNRNLDSIRCRAVIELLIGLQYASSLLERGVQDEDADGYDQVPRVAKR
jgi:hypothetical protein